MLIRHVITAAALLFAAPALADPWDFILTNEAGKEIKGVELSPAGAGAWKANELDPEANRDGKIKAGGRSTIKFDKAANQCKYDLQVTFADDSKTVWSGINVCDAAYVTIRYTNGNPVFTAS